MPRHVFIKSVFLLFVFITINLAFSCSANESFRISGMGGAFVAIPFGEISVFGNPASLINVRDNNVSVSFLTQNLGSKSFPLATGEQANTRFSFRLTPSLYYAKTIKNFGIGLGYTYDLDNRETSIKVNATTAEYIVNERKFIANTNTIFGYDLFTEKTPILSLAYSVNPELALGIRLKYRNQVFKKGVITQPFILTAVHDPDVNRNDATKLLPAIINNLDIGKSIENFQNGKYSDEKVDADISGKGLDIDFGMQSKVYDKWNITAGFMIDHLIQRKIALPQPSILRLGIGAIPYSWINTGMDIHKTLNSKGFGINVGWEAFYSWQKWFRGGAVFRNGYSYESSKSIVSIGIGVKLGSSEWNYALVKILDGSPISIATHLISSSTRF